ncbi:MAG: 23S rRNA (guanosine(2251)-2'-O)-methyltransferase RlmB [Bacteroidales bacterium]|nr:23S rRNA (guanosine(2251)-2'-O)-methyltransferase RlmB [Bacteroidales bacterium]
MIQKKSNQKGRDNQPFHVKHRTDFNSGEGSRGAGKAPRSKQQLVCGLRPVMEAIDSDQQIDKILIQSGLDGSLMQELRAKIRDKGLPFQYVPAEKLDRMTDSNHQGVVATISPIRFHDFMELLNRLLEQEKVPFVVLLDHLTDVRNVGAIVRTAECAGVDAVVVPDHGSAQISEDAIKSSSGALLRVPICRESNMKTVVNYARQSGLQVVAASEKGATDYVEVDFTVPTLLVMGSEDTGISPELLKMTDCRAKLPMRGEVQSLNVSVAAGIFFYEMLRQRNR